VGGEGAWTLRTTRTRKRERDVAFVYASKVACQWRVSSICQFISDSGICGRVGAGEARERRAYTSYAGYAYTMARGAVEDPLALHDQSAETSRERDVGRALRGGARAAMREEGRAVARHVPRRPLNRKKYVYGNTSIQLRDGTVKALRETHPFNHPHRRPPPPDPAIQSVQGSFCEWFGRERYHRVKKLRRALFDTSTAQQVMGTTSNSTGTLSGWWGVCPLRLTFQNRRSPENSCSTGVPGSPPRSTHTHVHSQSM
jgi:hypothetical protein